MNEYSHPEFSRLAEEKSNQNCFDCGKYIYNLGKTPACWASVNIAIYLCIDCAGLHRGFGVEISYIRSITMDKWKEKHLQLMKRGGNKRLTEFFKKNEINPNISRDDIYFTKLLEYYRKLVITFLIS